MRVCFVAQSAHGFSGWGRHTVEIIRGVRELGVEPVLVTSDDRLDPALVGIEHHVLLPQLFTGRFETPRSLRAAPRLRRIIKTCDLVHCTVELYLPLVAAAVPAGIPFVQTAHGTWAVRPFENPRQRMFFQPALRRVNRLLPVSKYTLGRMSDLVMLPPAEVVSGGVHPQDFSRDVSHVALPGWAQAGRILLSVGAVKNRKGQHIALEAAARVRQQLPDLHYVVIGSLQAETYVQELRRRAADPGSGSFLHLLGEVSFDELVAWYQRADVFAMLSISQGNSFEGLGLVYLEAGAAGTPSIGTLNCGAQEAIIDGETGLLVPQGDTAASADALLRVLTDDTLRARMAENARKRAGELTWANFAERLTGIYSELGAGA